jgi:hypothetical protein
MVEITQTLLKREEEVRSAIEEYAELFDLDPNLIRAVITQESRFKADAVSPTGAYGYGQFTGIGAKQVGLIAEMTPLAVDLADFSKQEANDPDRGIKAICAFFWWLFYKKYARVEDKKLKLEAALTFYNAGGRPAALILKHGGHSAAAPYIHQLPGRYRSQADRYAPEVSLWYVAWHEHMQEEAADEANPVPAEPTNPFDQVALSSKYRALVEALKLLGEEDEHVDFVAITREGLTEITLILPGEY